MQLWDEDSGIFDDDDGLGAHAIIQYRTDITEYRRSAVFSEDGAEYVMDFRVTVA